MVVCCAAQHRHVVHQRHHAGSALQHHAIIEIVQEDFVETPWGNTIVDVLDDTERVSEAGLIINVPSM